MAKPKFKPHKQKSIIKETLERRVSAAQLENDECFKISFKHLDRSQGQSYYEWESGGMLGSAFETLAGYCGGPIRSQLGKKFTIYGNFPPKENTEFTHPTHVPEDAEWARIHVNGTHCLIGHVSGETFYLVFFDSGHKFWISELKHT